jgi:hypothetical protein
VCLESNGKILATARRRDDGWWESATWPQGPTGLWASAAEAPAAFLAARAARRPSGVAAHDVVGVQGMLMGWFASDTARASVRDQLAPLEKLGRARADTATRTLAAYLHEQGSIIKTAQRLHLYRNAVANRIRGITELAGRGFRGPRPAARPPARLPRAPAGLTVPGAGPAGSTRAHTPRGAPDSR